jgi:Sulfotransferase domain
MRILMWSGPRNLSTAMMRSFGARGDCAVWDEPFYAPYLKATGLDHPMRDDILASHEIDSSIVATACAAPAPDGSPLFYQKHMTHHMLPGFDLSFMDGLAGEVANVFLIRTPERVLASYVEKRESVTLPEIGFIAQAELYDRVADLTGQSPVVVDAADVTRDPAATLERLCAAIGISWTPAMLTWAPGIHTTDGVWAAHWYNAVSGSSGFDRRPEREITLPPHLMEIAEAARPIYERLAASSGRI